MSDIKTLVKALRCSASNYDGTQNCLNCQYRVLEEVKNDLPIPYDVEIDGKKYWESCDCDRIVLDAAEMLEKLGDKDYNNDWIPCSERLPEDSGYYLVTYHEWSERNYLPKYDDTYVRRMHYQKSEQFTGWNYPKCIDDNAETDTHREVLAWQPLPDIYKERDNNAKV